MRIDSFVLKIHYPKMRAIFYHDNVAIKKFKLDKEEFNQFQTSFFLKHPDTRKILHDMIIDLTPSKVPNPVPVFQIYPTAGEYVISTRPKNAEVVAGTYEDYLKQHKGSKIHDTSGN